MAMQVEQFARNSTERMDGPSSYILRQARRSQRGKRDLEAIDTTCTVYVGNLSFYTTEEQMYELFSQAGTIKRIVMGLDRMQRTPCGFCFVEYADHEGAVNCVKYLNETKLDDRVVSIDLDPGFVEGRQYGRGVAGGQVRDEFRQNYDPGRGGYGRRWDMAMEKDRQEQEEGERADRRMEDEEEQNSRPEADNGKQETLQGADKNENETQSNNEQMQD